MNKQAVGVKGGGMLGHADPGFTLRTYTHTADPQQVRAADTIGQLMAASM